MHGDTAGLTAHGGCGCEFHKLLNDVCDPECRGEACFNDNGACTRVQVGCPGCEDAWLNDGECNDECQTQACGWDMGDCVFANGSLVTPQKERCTRSCPASWVNDGECDPACNVETCNFDGGDCAPTPCAYTAPRSKSWCVLGGPSNARVPRAATTRRLFTPRFASAVPAQVRPRRFRRSRVGTPSGDARAAPRFQPRARWQGRPRLAPRLHADRPRHAVRGRRHAGDAARRRRGALLRGAGRQVRHAVPRRPEGQAGGADRARSRRHDHAGGRQPVVLQRLGVRQRALTADRARRAHDPIERPLRPHV